MIIQDNLPIMNRDHLTERTINIYLQVAETARFSKELSLSHSMLLAAFDQVNSFSRLVDQKILTKLAELLVMEKFDTQAEVIFAIALKNSASSSDDSWLRARIYDGLSEVYIRQANFEKARKKCEQALRIVAKLPGVDPALLSSRKRKLALINLFQGHNNKAHELFQEAEHSRACTTSSACKNES